MAKLINPADYIGKKYGRLTIAEVTRPIIYKKEERRWLVCICDCGNIGVYRMKDVVTGRILSCRCLLKEITINRNRKHDLTETPLHQVWCSMKGRCNNSTNTAYRNYGARGISVCKEWSNDFMPFYNWCISNGWQRGLQIDRIDVNGNYEPDNCRIVTGKVNSNNRRNNRYITHDNKTLTRTEWGEKLGMRPENISRRLDELKWSVEKTLTTKSRNSAKIKSIITQVF